MPGHDVTRFIRLGRPKDGPDLAMTIRFDRLLPCGRHPNSYTKGDIQGLNRAR
jgi:hypothetical protein